MRVVSFFYALATAAEEPSSNRTLLCSVVG